MKTLIALIIFMIACVAIGGEISELYSKSVSNKHWDQSKSRRYDEAVSNHHGITEIGIERTPCYGSCPVYTFIAKSDGTFRYKGVDHVARVGDFTGAISEWNFNQLAQFIRDSGFMELEDTYSERVTDQSTVYTTVVMNGKRKVISNYANAGPTKLWAIEELIDGLMTKANWSEPVKADDRHK